MRNSFALKNCIGYLCYIVECSVTPCSLLCKPSTWSSPDQQKCIPPRSTITPRNLPKLIPRSPAVTFHFPHARGKAAGGGERGAAHGSEPSPSRRDPASAANTERLNGPPLQQQWWASFPLLCAVPAPHLPGRQVSHLNADSFCRRRCQTSKKCARRGAQRRDL